MIAFWGPCPFCPPPLAQDSHGLPSFGAQDTESYTHTPLETPLPFTAAFKPRWATLHEAKTLILWKLFSKLRPPSRGVVSPHEVLTAQPHEGRRAETEAPTEGHRGSGAGGGPLPPRKEAERLHFAAWNRLSPKAQGRHVHWHGPPERAPSSVVLGGAPVLYRCVGTLMGELSQHRAGYREHRSEF